jgi:nitronate monooxygenase
MTRVRRAELDHQQEAASVLSDLIRRPVIVAPMAGGPTTSGLITAAAEGGAAGFLAAGYKSAPAMRADIDAVTAATSEAFGVNVFVPGTPAADPAALASYLEAIAADARQVGAEPGDASWDDDDWPAKIADLIARPVPIVSFTFGCPEPDVIAALQAAGSSVWVTVTGPREAGQAAAAGADCLCVQGAGAGAHRGTFTNPPGGMDTRIDTRNPGSMRGFIGRTGPGTAGDEASGGLLDLLAAIRGVSDLPLVAAGGIMDAGGVASVLAAGALAAQCGTAFLRCPESGAHPAYKTALADPRFAATEVTRAFSGRPARGLLNRFMLDHQDAPAAYPEINNATRPIRAAAAAAGDTGRMSLWAGVGYRAATARPAGEVIDLLCRPAS